MKLGKTSAVHLSRSTCSPQKNRLRPVLHKIMHLLLLKYLERLLIQHSYFRKSSQFLSLFCLLDTLIDTLLFLQAVRCASLCTHCRDGQSIQMKLDYYSNIKCFYYYIPVYSYFRRNMQFQSQLAQTDKKVNAEHISTADATRHLRSIYKATICLSF